MDLSNLNGIFWVVFWQWTCCTRLWRQFFLLGQKWCWAEPRTTFCCYVCCHKDDCRYWQCLHSTASIYGYSGWNVGWKWWLCWCNGTGDGRGDRHQKLRKKPNRVTSQTATGDVKLYLGDMFFFYGTIWFTQTKPCQLYLCNDFHELSTGIKSCFEPTMWTRIESTSFLWKMGDFYQPGMWSWTPRGFPVSSKWLKIFVKLGVW